MLTEAEFTRIYRKYVAMVQHRAHAVLRDRSLSEDVTQETFLRFVRYAQHQAIRSPGALLYRIATNLALQRLRHRNDHVSFLDTDALALAAAPPSVSAEDQILLADILQHSDPEEAALAVMYFVDGMSQDDIAAVCGLSRRTVGYRLQGFCDRAQRLVQKPVNLLRKERAEPSLLIDRIAAVMGRGGVPPKSAAE